MTVVVGEGLVHQRSSHSAVDTMTALEGVVRNRGISIAARIDHSGDAAKAGISMPPALLLIFGNPVAGTPLMLASPSIAIDLPLKALIWQDEGGVVWITYNSAAYLLQRHGVSEDLLKNIAGIASICEEAVR